MSTPRTRRRTRAAVASAALGLLVAGAPLASAAPAPDRGPTSGGTVVSGTVEPVTLVDVQAGTRHALALGSDGNAYAWGDGADGRLGTGATTGSGVPVPVAVADGVTFTRISTSAQHSLAIGSDGRTYAWGPGGDGVLGTGTTSGSAVPVPVSTPDGATFTEISASGIHSLAIGSDGRTYAWGSGANGRLGTGATEGSSVPVPVAAPDGVSFTRISASTSHSLAIGSDGQTYAWGYGLNGELGNGTTSATNPLPVLVSAPDGVTFTEVSAGSQFSLAIGSDGRTYAWGSGNDGRLGTGSSSRFPVPVPVAMPDGVTFTAVATGTSHALATGSDGRTYAWGSGNDGRLGTGTTTSSSVPVPVAAPDGVTFTRVEAGGQYSLAIGADGQAYAWGSGDYGRLGTGTTSSSSVPVPVDTRVTVEAVTFGDVPGTDLTQDGATWSVTTPARACGPVDVTVEHTQLGRARTRTTPGGFTFGSAPAVTGHPTGADLPAGGGAIELTAAADGDDVPAVQWQQAPAGTDDWTDVPDATDTTLQLDVTTTTDVRAVFTNCLGTATTDTASITVAPEPDPEPSPEPDPEPTPDSQPTPEPATPGATDALPGDDVLARTGWDGALAAALALALAVVGVALARVRRRLPRR